MDAIMALKTRRSIRVYEKRRVAREVLVDLVDCARLAPTAMNQQLNEFLIITNPETFHELAKLIIHSPWIEHAPAAVAVFCKDSKWYAEDASNAMMSILTAARAHGLGSCWISGDKQPYAEEVRKLLNAPDGLRFFAMAVVGHPAETIAKDKRPLENVMWWEKF